jgi:hypothetical protein
MARKGQNLLGRVATALKPDLDNDENGEERQIPVAAAGVIKRLNHVDSKGARHYDLAWDNGAWTVYSESEVLTDLKVIEG